MSYTNEQLTESLKNNQYETLSIDDKSIVKLNND